jgi:hypothetical protein
MCLCTVGHRAGAQKRARYEPIVPWHSARIQILPNIDRAPAVAQEAPPLMPEAQSGSKLIRPIFRDVPPRHPLPPKWPASHFGSIREESPFNLRFDLFTGRKSQPAMHFRPHVCSLTVKPISVLKALATSCGIRQSRGSMGFSAEYWHLALYNSPAYEPHCRQH